MAVTYGFYNSLNGDRTYNAEQMSAIFDGIITDGVFSSIGGALMTIAGEGMQVLVKTGKAWFNSTWTLNDAQMALAVDTADVGLTRIDAVVLEVNSGVSTRENSIKMVKGTPSANPTKPTMAADEDLHQYALAYITVGAGVTEITSANIEVNVGKDSCPFITSVLQQTSVSDLFNQWEAEFDAWFANIKAQLAGDVATNLQSQIDEVNSKTDANAESIKKQNKNYSLKVGDVLVTTNPDPGDEFELCNSSLVYVKDFPYTLPYGDIYLGNSVATTKYGTSNIVYDGNKYYIPFFRVLNSTNDYDIQLRVKSTKDFLTFDDAIVFNMPSTGSINAPMAYFNGYFVFAYKYSTSKIRIYYTTDIMAGTWNYYSIDAYSVNISGVKEGGGNLVFSGRAATKNGGSIYYPFILYTNNVDNGFTYTLLSNLTVSNSSYSIEYFNSKYVLSSYGDSKTIIAYANSPSSSWVEYTVSDNSDTIATFLSIVDDKLLYYAASNGNVNVWECSDIESNEWTYHSASYITGDEWFAYGSPQIIMKHNGTYLLIGPEIAIRASSLDDDWVDDDNIKSGLNACKIDDDNFAIYYRPVFSSNTDSYVGMYYQLSNILCTPEISIDNAYVFLKIKDSEVE